MNTTKIWAAIFDLDGVVVNTVPLHFKAWKKMFGEWGKKEFTFEDYKQKVDGIPRTSGARAILTDVSQSQLEEACKAKQDYFLELIESEGVPVYETTVKLIKEMRARQIKVALISSSKNLPRIIKVGGLTDIWDVIISGHEITRGKPDPQVFLTAAQRLKMPAGQCVVFEDAVLGVEAAKRGGMPCVGIDRHGTPDALAKADVVVSDLSEIDCDKIAGLVKG